MKVNIIDEHTVEITFSDGKITISEAKNEDEYVGPYGSAGKDGPG